MLASYCYKNINMPCLKTSDEYLLESNSYESVKNGMLYNSENAKIINMRITISVTAMTPRDRQNNFGTSLQNRSSLFSCCHEFKASTMGQL